MKKAQIPPKFVAMAIGVIVGGIIGGKLYPGIGTIVGAAIGFYVALKHF